MSRSIWAAVKLSGHRSAWGDVRALRAVFVLWIVAFALKHAGASWDLAWHFRFLRDDLIPPHVVNLSGNAFALALIYFQFRTGVAVERRGFMAIVAGFALFVAAIPIDLINHHLFGLDVTIWSVPHLMFFFGSTIVLLGLLRMWLRLAAPGRWKTAGTFVFLTLLMDCALFVLGQHEYGVLSVDAYLRGHPTASDDLLALAHGDVAGFASGHVPPWIYPIWMVLAATVTLLGARRAYPGAWTATLVAGLYLVYRAVSYALLSAATFPPSFIPVMLLGAGLAIALAARRRWRPVVASAALLLAFYGGAALIGRLTLMPAFAPWTALVVAGPLWGIVAAERWYSSQSERSALRT
jgi:hypothetical protein